MSQKRHVSNQKVNNNNNNKKVHITSHQIKTKQNHNEILLHSSKMPIVKDKIEVLAFRKSRKGNLGTPLAGKEISISMWKTALKTGSEISVHAA